MQRVIAGKNYDTETAALIKKITYSYYGDPNGYEEILFQIPSGHYFLYANGGATSKYPNERIRRISAINAKKWLKNN
jgi:hypothetical protein